jgi:hypothetical protein
MQNDRFRRAAGTRAGTCAAAAMLPLALAAALLPGTHAFAQAGSGFAQRLAAVGAAADRHLEQSPGELARFPADLRRIAWMHFEGDRWPDALLVLKQRRDDCAAASRGKRPCRALILTGKSDGSFDVATEFTLHEHPLVFRKVGAGTVTAMYFTADTTEAPQYRKFVLREGRFQPDGETASLKQLGELRTFVTDDRSLPLLIDQQYAATQFDNGQARLAPHRLHIDRINTAVSRANFELVHDAQFDERAAFLAKALSADAAKLTAAIGWHQTLDLRLWSCQDWMVPRRFWEIEDVRLGRVGTCIEPVVFAFRQGIVQTPAAFVAMARYRLLQEVGIAFVLRVAPLSWAQREQLKSAGARDELAFFGAAAGVLLGAMLQLQAPEAATDLHARWATVSARWFTQFERATRGFEYMSPELRAFEHDLRNTDVAVRCAQRVLGVPAARAAACPAQALESIEFLRRSLREAMNPS